MQKLMLRAERWVYIRFFCQQAIEKLVKGLYSLHIDFDKIPRVHNISLLIQDFAEDLPQQITPEQFDLFDLLSRYYLNDRYPDYVEEIPERVKEGDAKEIFEQTKEIFSWLQTLKP